ncbi:hypothetical protein Tco_0793774 [Tanacetum coccineum]
MASQQVHRESKDLTGKDMRPKEDPKAATSQCHDAEKETSVGSSDVTRGATDHVGDTSDRINNENVETSKPRQRGRPRAQFG